MTQEKRIEEVLSDLRIKLFTKYGLQSDEVLEVMTLVSKLIIESELNRKMEEVVRVYADKIKADINNGVEYNKKNYNRDEITKEQIFAYLDHWLHDLKALLNVVNADDNQQHEQRRDN